MPEIGDIAITPTGKGTIIDTYTLLEMVKVKVRLKDGTDDLFQYKITDIQLTEDKDKRFQKSSDNNNEDLDTKELDKIR